MKSTDKPTSQPTSRPSVQPSFQPSRQPSSRPTSYSASQNSYVWVALYTGYSQAVFTGAAWGANGTCAVLSGDRHRYCCRPLCYSSHAHSLTHKPSHSHTLTNTLTHSLTHLRSHPPTHLGYQSSNGLLIRSCDGGVTWSMTAPIITSYVPIVYTGDPPACMI